MKFVYRWIVRWLAIRVLRKYQPVIVAIAGSIGKTATKDAIAAALSTAKRVRKTEGNFNAEVGVPITIIAGGGPRHGLQWLWVPFAGLKTWLSAQVYPDVLVLELGTNRPGDLQPLMRLVQPKVGVLTAIAPEHLEFFGDLDGVAQEEASIIESLPAGSVGIINADDVLSVSRMKSTNQQPRTFGWSGGAHFKAVHSEPTRDDHGRPTGQMLKVTVDGSTVPIEQPGVIGKHQAYPFLAAFSVAAALDIPISEALKGLRTYVPPPGRMRVLAGLNGSTIIDDSYNASPHAMAAALETLGDLQVPGKRIAILGQMSELGTASVNWHTWVGEKILPDMCHVLVTVGPLAERIGQAAIEKGYPQSQVVNVPNAEAAAAEIRATLGPNDVVLLKGSRFASHLERAAKLLLLFPERDAHLLVEDHEP